MTLLLAYTRERLTAGRVLPAVSLVACAALAARGWSGTTAAATDVVLALTLVIAFRIWDDVMDREVDRARHPNRVVVTARSLAPLWIAATVLGAVAGVLLLLAYGVASVAIVAVYAGILTASYTTRESRSAAHDRILLLKYLAFTLALSGAQAAFTVRGLLAGAAAFAVACIYEWWHDAESAVFSVGGSR